MVVQALRLVALEPERQVSALPKFVVASDEISTSFYDAYLLVPQLRKRNFVNEQAYETLRSLDDWFENMPTDGSIVENESLGNHEFWNTARKLAKEALLHLKEDICEPDLSHMFWTEGD